MPSDAKPFKRVGIYADGATSFLRGTPTIDFSFPTESWVQDSYGFYVTGNYWYFKGIDITRSGYQGAYVTGQKRRVYDG